MRQWEIQRNKKQRAVGLEQEASLHRQHFIRMLLKVWPVGPPEFDKSTSSFLTWEGSVIPQIFSFACSQGTLSHLPHALLPFNIYKLQLAHI